MEVNDWMMKALGNHCGESKLALFLSVSEALASSDSSPDTSLHHHLLQSCVQYFQFWTFTQIHVCCMESSTNTKFMIHYLLYCTVPPWSDACDVVLAIILILVLKSFVFWIEVWKLSANGFYTILCGPQVYSLLYFIYLTFI